VERLSIQRGSSKAVVDTLGAYVAEVSLDSEPVVKPSADGSQTHGGIAVLIPYAGRVRRGEYHFEGKSFKLTVGRDGHAIHGIAKDARWELRKKGPDFVRLTTRLHAEGYPGVVRATVAYSVTGTSFSTACEVRNVGGTDAPMVIGFHPYFLGKDWRISTEDMVQRYILRDRYFPTGKVVPYSFEGVGPDQRLDDCFRVDGSVSVRAGAHRVVISRNRMPYLVVYDGRYSEGESVAVEPYTGLPDAYNNGIGLNVLGPGESLSCGYRFRIEGT
jgi:aldose 1-epimerase